MSFETLPDDETRIERERWFSMSFTAAGPDRYAGPISTHALLLEVDIRRAFVAGAWISTITLAFAAIEAQFRQVFAGDYENRAQLLFGENADLNWLRNLRNSIVHAGQPGLPSPVWGSSPGDLLGTHANLEANARRAVAIMFRENYGRRPA
ncbi:hypothetical protein GCM10025771_13660 [Niveibacterium umoris]|uniref:Uncharacterized protein n=1 Tax=Niveibacterium umoris TaxID=1193620 RepID=A0A840BNQ9_9RHOO|nr:hypothetical protein [Niveibacterium umoris]MBB4014945.1 hypothetical protein [Niveibacterium umoris]